MERFRHMHEGYDEGRFRHQEALQHIWMLGLGHTMLKIDAWKDTHIGAVKP